MLRGLQNAVRWKEFD